MIAHQRSVVPLLGIVAAASPIAVLLSFGPFTTYRLDHRAGALDVCTPTSGLRFSGGVCDGASASAWAGPTDWPIVALLVLAGMLAVAALRLPSRRAIFTLAAGMAAAIGAVLAAAAIANAPDATFTASVVHGGSLTTSVPDSFLIIGRGWAFWSTLALTWLATAAAAASRLASRDVAVPVPVGHGAEPGQGWWPGQPGWPMWSPSGPGLGDRPRSYPQQVTARPSDPYA